MASASDDPECQVTSFRALCTALRHPALTSDPKMVCSLLQCCKSWRAALQQCGSGNTVIQTQDMPQLLDLSTFSDFVSWIPKHAGLLAELHLDRPFRASFKASHCGVKEQMLAMALQSTEAVGPTAAQKLGLKSFSTRFLSRPALLEALPAASLTSLGLHDWAGIQGQVINSSTLRGLSRLSNLQELSMYGIRDEIKFSRQCVGLIGQLSCLTNLHVEAFEEGSDMQLLPRQLQQLHLKVLCGDSPLALGHLTALQQLSLTLQGSPAPGSCLPTQLTDLAVVPCIECSVEHLNIPGLLQLQRLEARDIFCKSEQLQQLAALPQLQHISLDYETTLAAAAAAAPAWQHLPQLRKLSIWGDESELDDDEVSGLVDGIASATGLTSLSLSLDGIDDAAAYYNCLAGLRQLRDLEMAGMHSASRQNPLKLTALTGLTRLHAYGAAINDVVAVALACRLTQLQDLQLNGSALRSSAVLPAIAALTGLSALDISDNPADGFEQGDIMLLTTLRSLQSLSCRGVFSADAQAMFWAAVKGQQAAAASGTE